ncbi:MAG: hypothetical protein IPH05_00675 [Flavobacteriales bacterium]|jgi:hypothetical protein|nr:hypothetical protein [Flavobacteriales bacterium]MBK6550375.1 hypothetical protein [Flavobacteriales bacterium]MBK6881460.1 hypothetical protein [Flavobacteriales bacterium]MBK7102777.1 hypothetical protein [Flavobacteriales bacterium]MBK7113617.1 hypothetical protein [Flavobacteriales bacterium]
MSAPHTKPKSAVLFIGFKRYDESKAVIEAIRAVRPSRFYFACDGARADKSGEAEEVERVRSLTALVDWPCEFRTLFSDTNRSVRLGPPAAIDWFFDHEEEGIILEDDCLPMPTWFRYADEMLERYRNDERVWVIQGNNLMPQWRTPLDDSYYFSAHGYGAYWGWASWRRTWKKYDLQMQDWPAVRDSGLLEGHFLSASEREEVYMIFEKSWNGEIHSWDYQLDYGRMVHGAVNIIPSNNLIRNIGFGSASTHTGSEEDPRNMDNAEDASFPIKHPMHVLVDNRRDLAYFEQFIEPSPLRRIKSLVKQTLPTNMDRSITPYLSKLQRKLGIQR